MKNAPFGIGKSKPHDTENVFLFGGKQFPLSHLTKHALIIGQTGSGKSVSLLLLLLSILVEIGKHAHEGGYRAVIYDPKSEMLPQLEGMGVTCPIHINNPFHLIASAWQMSKDITGPAAALQVACAFIPEEETMQPFFNQAARLLLFGVLLALHLRAGEHWSLRHVALILRSISYLKQLLAQTPATRHIVALIRDEESKAVQSIMSTVQAKMLNFEIVAALFSRAEAEGRVFSVRDFIQREEIILLAVHEEAREATDAIHRAFIQLLSSQLLSQPVSSTRRTFLVFDELREAGDLPLRSLLLRGRAYGVCAVLCTQSKSGLDAVHGRETADELLDQCGFRLFLKCDGETAFWSGRQFGEQEWIALRTNESANYGGQRATYSQGRSEEFRKKETIMASELMSLPSASGREGLRGIVKTPWGSFRAHVDFASQLPPADANPPGFVRRPESDEYLEEFSQEELNRFGLIRVPAEEEAINWREMRQKLFQREKRRPKNDDSNW